ncbi:serine/threonine protein kinase [Streptomyces sp. NPDC127119]|uniref:serine/threonine protein kinase n=1 Tax=Streptomyces sp. NPDC127119 TaxID=3345370 RepID=UPI0036432791
MKPLDADADPPVLGPFELIARLGEGGMGVAYLARMMPLVGHVDELSASYHLIEPDEGADATESRFAVLKMIQPSLLDQPQARERFSMEIAAVGAVVSERVPALIARDSEAPKPWFAMDYVAGPDLHTMIKGSGTFALGPYAALGLALVDALRAIHGTGLLHRDLKPSNVVLGPDGPVVLDFGLAVLVERQSSQALTKTGDRMGTRPFMPFEQLRDTKHVKEPADVYALGATLFFALTGRPPYPYMPLMVPPTWDGVDAAFLPLLAQILVHTPGQRPDLDAVDTGLRTLLADADLTPEQAAEQLRTLVETSGLAPELPPEALAEHADPSVLELAQKAIDGGAAPDAPWGGGAAEASDEDLGFFGIVDTEEIERAEDAAAEKAAPSGYTPTAVDEPAAHPTAPTPPASPSEVDADAPAEPQSAPHRTSYRLQPPRHAANQPSPGTPPAAPRAALRVAERLRRAYAHSRTL